MAYSSKKEQAWQRAAAQNLPSGSVRKTAIIDKRDEMKYFWLTIILCLSSGAVVAQHEHPPAETKPAVLMPGLGHHHHPVSTRNPEAQRFFDQGLTLIFAFNHPEAARSFARAAELDPQLAMAHWGIALAVGPNYNEARVNTVRVKAAYDAIQKASSLVMAAPEHERAYIAALA